MFVTFSVWGQACCVAGNVLDLLMFCASRRIRRVVLVLGGLAIGAGLGLTMGVCGTRRPVMSCLKR
eukprot:scaffold252966_cov15-Tisochrysis_lutea.AAC.1